MKQTLLILQAFLYASLTFGQVAVKTTNTVYFLKELKKNNPALLSIGSGEILELDLRTGKYWEAKYMQQMGFLHKRDLKYCVPLDSTITIRNNSFHVKKSQNNRSVVSLKSDAVSVGKDLYSGGGFLATGIFTTVWGLAVLYFDNGHDIPYFPLTIITTGVFLEISGALKIMRAGKRLYFGQTSSGIGMSINLNK